MVPKSELVSASVGEIAMPPMLSLLSFALQASSWTLNLDLILRTSNHDFIATDVSETAQASAKKIVYGVISTDTHGLLLCLRTSKKKKPSPAKSKQIVEGVINRMEGVKTAALCCSVSKVGSRAETANRHVRQFPSL